MSGARPRRATTTRRLEAAEADAFAAARLRALDRMPYLATALFEVTPVAAPGLETFGVDAHWRLYLDPATLQRWGPAHAAGVLLHEVLHLLRDHHARHAEQPRQHPLRWNLAADAEINDDLTAAGVPLPGAPITPASLGQPDEQLAEEYYASLAAASDDRFVSVCCGSGSGGHPLPCEVGEHDGLTGRSRTEGELIRRAVADQVRDAAQQHLDAGTVPGGLRRWADRVLEPPKAPWSRLLRAAVRQSVAYQAGQVDFRYHRPGRRRVPQVVTPAMVSPTPTITTIIDTSASMSEPQLRRALSELQGVCRSSGIPARRHRVVSADVGLRSIQTVRSADEVRLTGGGGTDLAAAIEAVASLRPRPDVVVVLTDGATAWPARAPRHMSVVIGIIGPRAAHPGSLPQWARSVLLPIEDQA